jgi:phenylacetate-CoA ligase
VTVTDREYWDRAKETLPVPDRERAVLALLREQLAYAYEHLPFYRRLYDDNGFDPAQVQSLEDFTALVPVVTKDMLRADQEANPPFGSYLGIDTHDVARVHGSSGTTGTPTLYAISREDWSYSGEIMAQGFFTCGMRPDDIVQLATVFGLFLGGWGSLLAAERIGAAAFPLGAGETERQLELMYRVGSTVLITTPTYALHMLETARELGYDPANSPLRLGIFIGEPGSGIPGTRRTLEEGWGITVRDCATTSEMMPWATNAECEEGRGVHVINDEIWTEIVAKDDSTRLMPMGDSGAVVYTHLRRRSQPMIRFWCGDESRMVDDPCPCGRTYPRLPDGVYGRLDDMLIIRGANVYPSQVQRSLLGVPGAGVEFKIVLEREKALDVATLRVEQDPASEGTADAAALAERIRHKLKSDTNVHFDVEILEPHTLERAISKAQRVEDRRPSIRPEGGD